MLAGDDSSGGYGCRAVVLVTARSGRTEENPISMSDVRRDVRNPTQVKMKAGLDDRYI